MLNLVFAGNVGGDVALREVSVQGENTKVASFSVAVNNGKNAQGDDLPPTWIQVSVWRSYAETVAKFVKKGDHVLVVAESLRTTAWMSNEGEPRSGLEVSARRVDFGGNRHQQEEAGDIPF